MTYTVVADNKTVMESSAKLGTVPHNLTLDITAQQLLGPGVHHLEIIASSNTSESEVSEGLTIHLVEPITGFQAMLSSSSVKLGEDLEIKVSAPHGKPEKLRFEVTGSNETFLHLKDGPEGENKTYNIPVKSEGTAISKDRHVTDLNDQTMRKGGPQPKGCSRSLNQSQSLFSFGPGLVELSLE